nr:hypothetical protein [Trichoderma atroviride]
MSLGAVTLSRLRGTVDRACLDPPKDIPGVTVVVIGKDGKELFAHSAGKRGLVSKDPMTLDTVFWIASCTKILTGFACMQLVEKGAVQLDDGDSLENIVPELKKVQVLRKDRTYWAGVAVERISGLALNAYFQQFIFDPLGIKDMTMFPSKDMKDRLAYMHSRAPDGIIRPRDHLLQLSLVIDPNNVAETRRVFNRGGAGVFARPQEYCKVLAVLLNDGTYPRTGVQLLRKETVDEMFRNQIPQFPN